METTTCFAGGLLLLLIENGIYFGERYNARLEMPGWDRPGYDDSSWEQATRLKGTTPASQTMPPIGVTRTLKPKRIFSSKPGLYVCDFDQNFSGCLRITLSGNKGEEVTIRHVDLLNEDGTLNVHTNRKARTTDVYILKGEGVEEWQPRFTYHGFRYIEISGFPGVPRPENITGLFVYTDLQQTGEFSCSYELINQIHSLTWWSQLSNLMSIPTDCPRRDERHGWMGDILLVAEESLLNFDMAQFFNKYL